MQLSCLRKKVKVRGTIHLSPETERVPFSIYNFLADKKVGISRKSSKYLDKSIHKCLEDEQNIAVTGIIFLLDEEPTKDFQEEVNQEIAVLGIKVNFFMS
jgi:hypothetical protein